MPGWRLWMVTWVCLNAGGSVTCVNNRVSLSELHSIPGSRAGAGTMSTTHTLPPTSVKQPHAQPVTTPLLPHRGAYMQELEEAASELTPRHAAPQPSPSSASETQLPDAPTEAPAAAIPPSDAHAPASSGCQAFATLQWQVLQVELAAKAGKLDSVKVWLQEVSLQRPVPSAGLQAGRHDRHAPAATQDIFRLQASHGIEHSALQNSEGQPLACHVAWKLQHAAVTDHQVSVHVGTMTAVHIPGLITSAFTFAGLEDAKSQPSAAPAPADASRLSTTKTSADQANLAASLTDQAGTQTPVAEARSSLTLSVSVLGISLGALSSSDSDSHAVWLICSKLSAHLGQIRARGRPGSLVAGLLSLQKGPSPQHGLRVSAVGVQLGIVPAGWGNADASTLWPEGVQEVSEPVEVQALLQGWNLHQLPVKPQTEPAVHASQQPPTSARSSGPQVAWPTAPSWQTSQTSDRPVPTHQLPVYTASTPEPPSRLITAASSAVNLKLTGAQLAMLASVADAVSAETGRRFRQPLPQQVISPGNLQDEGKPAWLGLVSIQTAPAYIMLTLDKALDDILATVPSGLRSTLAQTAESQPAEDSPHPGGIREGSAPAVVVMCDKLSVTVAVGPAGANMPAVCINLVQPHAWASPAVKACIPACEVHVAVVAVQSQHTHSQSKHLTSPEAPTTTPEYATPVLASEEGQLVAVEVLGAPLAVVSSVDIAVTSKQGKQQLLQGGSAVTVGIQSISLDVEPVHIAQLVDWVQCTMLGPTLPVLPTYPQHAQPPNGRVEIQMIAQMLFGQLQVGSMANEEPGDSPPDLAFWLTAPTFSYSKDTAQVCSCAVVTGIAVHVAEST